MDQVEIKKVIITTLSRRGTGVEGDPVRVLTEIWDMEGSKMAEVDSHEPKMFTETQMASFAYWAAISKIDPMNGGMVAFKEAFKEWNDPANY